MEDLKSIIRYQTQEYGRIVVKLDKVQKKKKISRNRLKTSTGVKYDVITRYYRGEQIELVDLNFLAKVCYTLDCRIEDLLEYQRPE